METKRKCFWRHNWGLWQTERTEDVFRSHDQKYIGIAIIQKRTCADCGFTKYNQQNVTL